ncbi:hypothetical protein CHRYSEOSP005_25810 [Chryseobacterium sp. Alg-005]|uniref:hypothetical protein n=1 Tax=Chryseobacterium sp. Alg-005 TaxID=3159516 RepID=UPI0035558ACB
MKVKFGIVFYMISEVITLYLGIYFLKISILFSIIFFVAAIAILLFMYKQYLSHKTMDIPINENTVPEEIQIKYSVSLKMINISFYLILIIIGVFMLTLLYYKKKFDNIFGTISALALLAFPFIMVIKDIKKTSSVVISINNEGIQLNKNPRIKWSEIQHEKIITKHVKDSISHHQYSSEVNYLYFYHKNEKIEVEIDDLNVTDYNLSQYLIIYRDRFNEENKLRA